MVSPKLNSRVWRGADWSGVAKYYVLPHLMGQWFSRASCSIRGGHDMPVVEPVVVRTTIPRRESSLASYTGRRSHRGSVPSTSGEGYCNVGLNDDSARRELEGRKQEMQEDHYHDMYMWYLDQFDEDPTEQRVMRAHIQAWGFRGPPVVAAVLAEDSEEDPEEDSVGSDDYVPRGNIHPEAESSSRDATSHLVEAIERLVAQNVHNSNLDNNNLRGLMRDPEEILQRVQLIAKDPAPVAGGSTGSSSTLAKKQWKIGFSQKQKFDGKPWSSTNRGDNNNKKFKTGDNRSGVP
ncbi:hypothetical protein FNV43_RR16748 [Rhamnella rubrinervis]|uniref:Uncharacterized protein n=1 Tax=Rhamnella rubrinervis TaxID=2594499 RepID=A0A8K0GZF2_9ROSA|nr:hypothetical protein FNV43_RR16748 [Rhamnella rubrinervis]